MELLLYHLLIDFHCAGAWQSIFLCSIAYLQEQLTYQKLLSVIFMAGP